MFLLNNSGTVDGGLFKINEPAPSQLELSVGRHRFIQSVTSNGGHPIKFSINSVDVTHNSGTENTDLVTYNEIPEHIIITLNL